MKMENEKSCFFRCVLRINPMAWLARWMWLSVLGLSGFSGAGDGLAADSEPTKNCGIVYLNATTESQFQRILDAPEIAFVHVQGYMNDPVASALVKNRLAALHQAGKKVLFQAWYGPGGRYNWSYHSMTAIGRDPEVAKDFLAGLDFLVESHGAENLYGLLLFEEGGYQGFDIDEPGDWRLNEKGIVSGKENNSADNYGNYEKFGGAWSARAPNVRRFESQLKQVTGLELSGSSAWDQEQNGAFEQWMRRDLYSASQRVVAAHLAQKYPHIKFFAWDIRLGHARVATAWDFGADFIQGNIADPYASATMNYHVFANIKTVNPKSQLLALLWGGYASRDIKARRLTTAYMCGATGLGFFEGSGTDSKGRVFMRREGKVIAKTENEQSGIQAMDYADPETFALNRELYDAFSKLPPFHFNPRTLIISGDIVSNGTTAMEWTQTFYNYPAHCNSAEAHAVPLAPYQLLVVHYRVPFVDRSKAQAKYRLPLPGIDVRQFEDFVKQGGLAVVYGVPDGWEKTFLKTRCGVEVEEEQKQFKSDYQPSEWLKKQFGMGREYQLNLKYSDILAGKTPFDHQGDLVHILTFGKGKVLWLPFVNQTALAAEQPGADGTPPSTREFSNYVQFLQDLTYGFCRYARGGDLADREVNDPQSGVRYFRAADRQSGILCVMLKDDVPKGEDGVPKGEMRVHGKDLLTGVENPVLNKDRTVVVVKGD